MMVLKTWRDRYGCSFLIAHHSRKNIDPDSTAREDSWGSQFLNAFLEAGWQIRRNPRLADNEVVVRRHSKVMGNQPPVSLTFDISTVHPMHYRVDVRDYQAAPGQGQRKPAQASLLLSLESVFAVVSSVIFYHELVTPRIAVGFATIFVAVLVSELFVGRFKRGQTPFESSGRKHDSGV